MVSESSFERKSYLRSLLQYRQFIGGQSYKRQYGFDEGLVVLFLTTSRRQLERMLETTMKISSGTGNAYMLFKCLPAGAQFCQRPMPVPFSEPWLRAGKKDVELHSL